MVQISPRVRALVDKLVVARWHNICVALRSSVYDAADIFGTPPVIVLLRRSLRGVVDVVGWDMCVCVCGGGGGSNNITRLHWITREIRQHILVRVMSHAEPCNAHGAYFVES